MPSFITAYTVISRFSPTFRVRERVLTENDLISATTETLHSAVLPLKSVAVSVATPTDFAVTVASPLTESTSSSDDDSLKTKPEDEPDSNEKSSAVYVLLSPTYIDFSVSLKPKRTAVEVEHDTPKQPVEPRMSIAASNVAISVIFSFLRRFFIFDYIIPPLSPFYNFFRADIALFNNNLTFPKFRSLIFYAVLTWL